MVLNKQGDVWSISCWRAAFLVDDLKEQLELVILKISAHFFWYCVYYVAPSNGGTDKGVFSFTFESVWKLNSSQTAHGNNGVLVFFILSTTFWVTKEPLECILFLFRWVNQFPFWFYGVTRPLRHNQRENLLNESLSIHSSFLFSTIHPSIHHLPINLYDLSALQWQFLNTFTY